jgi:hypothetical protein
LELLVCAMRHEFAASNNAQDGEWITARHFLVVMQESITRVESPSIRRQLKGVT